MSQTPEPPNTAPNAPVDPLLRAAAERRSVWLSPTRSRATWDAATRALVGPGRRSSLEWWLASGVLVDVAEGRPPSGVVELPAAWRELPADVLAALGLPEGANAWRGRSVGAAPDESVRAASLAAAACEADGDEAGRRVAAEIMRDRLGRPERRDPLVEAVEGLARAARSRPSRPVFR